MTSSSSELFRNYLSIIKANWDAAAAGDAAALAAVAETQKNTIALITEDPSLAFAEIDGKPNIYLALETGDLVVIRALLEKQTKSRRFVLLQMFYPIRHYSLLHYAAAGGNVALCYLLIKFGAKIDFVPRVLENDQEKMFTPLLYALMLGQERTALLLINQGADWRQICGSIDDVLRFKLLVWVNKVRPVPSQEFNQEMLNLVNMAQELKTQVQDKKSSIASLQHRVQFLQIANASLHQLQAFLDNCNLFSPARFPGFSGKEKKLLDARGHVFEHGGRVFKQLQYSPLVHRAVCNEIAIMIKLHKYNHPNILQLKQIFIEGSQVLLQLPYCSEGDVTPLVKPYDSSLDSKTKKESQGSIANPSFFPWSSQKEVELTQGIMEPIITPSSTPETSESDGTKLALLQHLSFSARMSVVRQLLLAVEHLHQNEVYHRDIKPSNLLIHNSGTGGEITTPIVVKLADFGLSKDDDVDTRVVTVTEETKRIGTFRYMAPEIRKRLAMKHLVAAQDMWSVGVLAAELLFEPARTRRNPSLAPDSLEDLIGPDVLADETLSALIGRQDYIDATDLQTRRYALDLVQKLLSIEPSERPSATEALEHQLFTQRKVVIKSFHYDKLYNIIYNKNYK